MIVRRSLAVAVGLLLTGLALVTAPRALAGNSVVTASPKALEFAPNRGTLQVVVLTNTGRFPLALQLQVTKPFQVTATSLNLLPGDPTRVGVTLDDHDPQKPIKNGKLRILNRTGILEASVKLSYNPNDSKLPPVAVAPASLDFGTVPPGTPADRTVTLLYIGRNAASTVTATTRPPLSFGGSASITGTFGLEGFLPVTVTYSPETPGESVNTTIDFMGGGRVVASLPVKGKAGPGAPAILTFNPPKVDFGSVDFPLDESSVVRNQDLTLTNRSRHLLKLSFGPLDRPFQLLWRSSDPFVLNPAGTNGDSHDPVRITYEMHDNHDIGEFNPTLLIHVEEYTPEPVNGKLKLLGRHDERVKIHVQGVPTPASVALRPAGDERNSPSCPIDPPPPPPWLSFCGVAPTEEEVRKPAVGNYSRNFSYVVTWDALRGPPFDIDAPPPGGLVLAPGKVASIPVRFTADAGNETGTELVRAGAPEPSGKVTFSDLGTITLLGNVNACSIGPSTIDFGTAGAGAHPTRQFTVYNHGPSGPKTKDGRLWVAIGGSNSLCSFLILDETSNPPGYGGQTFGTVAPGGHQVFTARFEGAGNPGVCSDNLLLVDRSPFEQGATLLPGGAIMQVHYVQRTGPQRPRRRSPPR